jgi:16S rRNA (uracil1498-N3)-methyltransferase
LKILKLQDKDNIRVGVVDIGITDKATVHFSPPQELEERIGKESSGVIWVNLGQSTALIQREKPRIDLLLALPRPQRLRKLIPVISCLGVHRLVLVNADKVENDYFGEFFPFISNNTG